MVPDVRQVQQQWCPMIEKCNNNGPQCSNSATTLVLMFEKCNNNGPDVRKVQQQWSPMFGKCNDNGPRCSKSATTMVPDVLKVQQ